MPTALISSLFGGKSLPTFQQSSAAGPAVSSSNTGASSGAGISVLSPGAGLNIGSTGLIVLALVALVGVIYVLREG